jgi:hypothetical protein
VKPEEAEVEWDAQIKKILDTGVTVSHLDGHMLCYQRTSRLFTAAFTLARKHGIPLISPFMQELMPAEMKRYLPLSSYTGIYMLAKGVEETLENRTTSYWKMLGSLPPGIHYIYSHHGWEPPDGKITGDLDIRIDDYKFWTSELTKETLTRKGYVMIGCRPLKEDFGWRISSSS